MEEEKIIDSLCKIINILSEEVLSLKTQIRKLEERNRALKSVIDDIDNSDEKK